MVAVEGLKVTSQKMRPSCGGKVSNLEFAHRNDEKKVFFGRVPNGAGRTTAAVYSACWQQCLVERSSGGN